MTVSRFVAAVAMLIILIAIVAFVVRNPGERVVIDLGWRVYHDVSLVYALFGAFFVGIVLTLLYTLYYFIGLGFTVRRLKKRNRDLERELIALRNLPIEESLEGEESDQGKEVVL
jgi:uncharacterized integral membrane protein